MKATMAGDEASAKQLLNLADIQATVEKSQGGGTQKVSANAQKIIMQADNALNVLDSVERAFNVAGGAKGAISGTVANLAGKVRLDQNARYYNDIARGEMARIIRGLGEVGTLAEGDVQRALGLMPSLADTQENAARKIAELKNLFALAKQNALTSPSTSGSSEDLLSNLGY
jgi:preprotein translocase subunit Sec63